METFSKNDVAKILIFYDFRNFSDFTQKWPPIDASRIDSSLASPGETSAGATSALRYMYVQ